ncbi:hypothetical protein NC653_022730 [Populus alba x Populus x berolinensis]|uniref:Uncharacterized protein n=1 Tax=Populus alba x Populus x berolinensis TaxID=444605 RepID=A0AAD6MG33_9ROSI|nr:hypothetical protein NC653_022730 [Populus alba x Populus x berolinensis]
MAGYLQSARQGRVAEDTWSVKALGNCDSNRISLHKISCRNKDCNGYRSHIHQEVHRMESFPGNTVRLSNLVHSNPDIRTTTYRAGSSFELQKCRGIHYPSEDSKIP